MAIDAGRRDGIILMEFGLFIQQMGAVRHFKTETYTHRGQSCKIYRDAGDGEGKAKAVAAKLAVRTVIDKGFDLPVDLRFYCTNNYAVQNRAFNRDAGWNNVSWITLGTTALQNGRADALSAVITPGHTKGSITCIHEIGHCLHAHARGDDFFDPTANLVGGPVNAGLVSGYAGMNRKEFVAEVFAGMMVGRHWPRVVMDEYMAYGGPH